MDHDIILASGGLDSSVLVAQHSKRRLPNSTLMGVSINYGQSHKKELDAAEAICKYYNVEHRIIDLRHLIMSFDEENCGGLLTGDIPDVKYEDIEGVSPTYVPFRNGIFLSAVAGLATSRCKKNDKAFIYYAAHRDDAAGDAYPDCSMEFIEHIRKAIHIGTYRQVLLSSSFERITKAEIVRMGHKIEVPFEMTWSCYRGGEKHCDKCSTCYARKQAFMNAGIIDPTEYEA